MYAQLCLACSYPAAGAWWQRHTQWAVRDSSLQDEGERLKPWMRCLLQLVHAYNKVCERNDQSLFHYGFIQDTDPPRLAALDLPSGNLYDEVAYNETDYGGTLQLSAHIINARCYSPVEVALAQMFGCSANSDEN